MAAPNLKPFYIGLVVIALIGAGAILYSRSRGSAASAIRTVNSAAAVPGDSSAHAGYVMGSATAPVEVEEYADFECPACQQFAVLTMPDVRDRLIQTGQVRWRFRDFPLYSIHFKTATAHEAAACAADQGKFWEMHDQLFFNQGKWVQARNSERTIRDLAKAAGVDLGPYEECMDSDRHVARIAASGKQGESRGVTSTPTLIIGTMMIPGSVTYDSLKAIIQNVASGKLKTS